MTGLMMGFSWFEVAAIVRYDYRSGFAPNPIGCCGAPSYFPDLSYATWASQYYLYNIWSYAPANVGIFRWHGGSDTPEPLYLSSQSARLAQRFAGGRPGRCSARATM